MVESRRFQTGEIAYVLQGLRTVNLLAFKQRRPFLTAMVSEIHPPSTSTLLPEQQFDYSRGETLSTTTTSSTAAPAMSYLDILASEELCEDIYKDLCTVLRLYKLLSRRPVDPTPQSTGFELFAPDGMPEPSGATMTEHTLGTGTGTVEANHADQAKELSSEELQTSPPPPPPSPTPTQPSAKARSTVAELLAARTGVPGVELPAEIFQNRPMAALEYTHDVLAEMVGHGEELLAHLNALPIPGEGKVSSVDVSAAHSSVSVVSAPRKYSTREGGTSLLRKRFKRLRTLASTALRTTVNIFRLPGRKLNMICRAVLQRLLDELPLQQSSSDESEVTTTETSAARPSSSSHQELTLPTDPHISALVHRMRAEVRATQEGMRLRLRSMATEVKDLSALLQFVEDRVKSPSEGVEFSSSAHESSATTVMADNGETVDLTPLLRRHEIFSHAMCLPTASRDPKQLQQCIEMDTLTRLRTVASALNADKEHLIQHALAESLLTRRDVHELEEVDLGNDLDVRCFHDVNITNAVFMGLEDIQAQDTITSVASTAVSHELIQDDLAVSLNKRSVVNATTADAPADRDEALSVRDPRRATPSSCIAVNTKNVESEDSGKQIVNARTIVHDSFFAVDGMFLQ